MVQHPWTKTGKVLTLENTERKKKTLSQYKFFLSLVSGLQKQTKWFLSWTGRAVILFLLIRCLLNFHSRNYQSANRQKIEVEGMAKMNRMRKQRSKQSSFVFDSVTHRSNNHLLSKLFIPEALLWLTKYEVAHLLCLPGNERKGSFLNLNYNTANLFL